MAITVAPALLPNGGKKKGPIHSQALTPKELRNVTGKPKVCWIVSSDFEEKKNQPNNFKANKLSNIQDGKL